MLSGVTVVTQSRRKIHMAMLDKILVNYVPLQGIHSSSRSSFGVAVRVSDEMQASCHLNCRYCVYGFLSFGFQNCTTLNSDHRNNHSQLLLQLVYSTVYI